MILHIFVFLVSHSNEYPLGFNRRGKKDKQKKHQLEKNLSEQK